MQFSHTSSKRKRGNPWRFTYGPSLALRCGMTVIVALCSKSTGAEERAWEFQPYRIDAVIAIDAPGGLADKLAGELPTYLQRRVTAAIGVPWSSAPKIATGIQR